MSEEKKPFWMRVGKIGWWLIEDLFYLVTFIGEVAIAVGNALRHPTKIRFRETLYYMDLCGSNALPIASLICLSMGIILGFQGAVQAQKYGQAAFLAPIVAWMIFIELGPLMVAMIEIGRAGSAFAAEIGTMQAADEVDALQTMGLVPHRFLVIPKLLAMVTVMPLLTIYGSIAGIVGGMLIGCMLLDIPVNTYLKQTIDGIQGIYIVQALVKSVVFGAIIAVVGCMRGMTAERNAQGVGRAATSAVVSSIFWVIIFDTLITSYFMLVFP